MIKPIYLIGLTATIGLAVITKPAPVSGDFDLPGLNRQVQRHQEVLDNHEARIDNLENDTKVLQYNTGTAPAPDPVIVPIVPQPAPEPEPTPVVEGSNHATSPTCVSPDGQPCPSKP